MPKRASFSLSRSIYSLSSASASRPLSRTLSRSSASSIRLSNWLYVSLSSLLAILVSVFIFLSGATLISNSGFLWLEYRSPERSEKDDISNSCFANAICSGVSEAILFSSSKSTSRSKAAISSLACSVSSGIGTLSRLSFGTKGFAEL